MSTAFRRHPQFPMQFDELLVDSFAGGGGASTGIEAAMGRSVDIAINHNPVALEVHTVNHPHTRHYCESVWEVDPREATQGRPVALAWFSPDCRHFSKAKGGAPVSQRVRGLAWVALRWAHRVRPRVIMLENVEEFQTWGPLRQDEHGKPYPCEKRKGQTFRAFVAALEQHGYRVEFRELRGCDYGAPTIRKRLFMVARCDGQPIVWPEPTHGPGLKPYRTAAEIIDWSLPCPSIFERKRPLAEATCRRIATGVMRYVVNSPDPFVVPLRGTSGSHRSAHRIHQPVSTITASGTHHALVEPLIAPFLTEHANASSQRNMPAGEPLRSAHARGNDSHSALVAAFLAKHYGGVVGQPMTAPLGTVTTVDHHSLVQAFLVKYYSAGGQWQDLREPLHTIPTKDRIGLVMVHGKPYRIVDIGLRMLEPHELAAAQGFPADYLLHGTAGRPLSKADRVRLIGNSVCPPVAEALVRANLSDTIRFEAAA